jgi:hypothetical protein
MSTWRGILLATSQDFYDWSEHGMIVADNETSVDLLY